MLRMRSGSVFVLVPDEQKAGPLMLCRPCCFCSCSATRSGGVFFERAVSSTCCLFPQPCMFTDWVCLGEKGHIDGGLCFLMGLDFRTGRTHRWELAGGNCMSTFLRSERIERSERNERLQISRGALWSKGREIQTWNNINRQFKRR